MLYRISHTATCVLINAENAVRKIPIAHISAAPSIHRPTDHDLSLFLLQCFRRKVAQCNNSNFLIAKMNMYQLSHSVERACYKSAARSYISQ